VELFILILVIVLGVHIAVQVASRATRSAVVTSLSPLEALEAFEQCFIAKANHIDRGMGQVFVRSRLKKHAPTITAEARATDSGTEVDVWMSDFIVVYKWGIPLGKYHAGWALRKQFKYLRRLRALDSPPEAGGSHAASEAGRPERAPREPENFNDPHLDDASWLSAGESRYDTLVRSHFGSPDTIAAGGMQRSQLGDPAAALFFFQKSIDTLHSIYVAGFGDRSPADWSRQPSDRDLGIVDAYLQELRRVCALRPGAPVKDSVIEVTHRLRTISSTFARYGVDDTGYRDRLTTLGQLAPDIDVSGVLWN
jgi:hypothetical protein